MGLNDKATADTLQYVDCPDRILLDASAIIGAGYGRSHAFRRLLRDAGDKRIQVIVPELAILETLAVYRRKLNEVASADAVRLFRAGGIELPSADDLVATCEEYLRGALGDAGIEPRASEANHDELVRRILARRKPTKPAKTDGKGREISDQPEDYRDQLLWSMVRSEARDGPLIFVSDNTNDFADENAIDRTAGRAELHADLKQDLVDDGDADASTVSFFLTIRRAVDDCLTRPEDEDDREELERLLADGAEATLAEELRRYVHSSRVNVTNFTPTVTLTSDLEEAELVDIDLEVDTDVVDAYQLSSQEEPRRYEVALDVQVTGDVAWVVTAVSSFDLDALGPLVESPDAGGIIHDMDTNVTLHLRAAGVYSPSEARWLEVEIEEAEQVSTQ